MRRLMTFIVRLWLEMQPQPVAWDGQVECVGDGVCEHICTQEELLAFIDAHVAAAIEKPALTGLEPPQRT